MLLEKIKSLAKKHQAENVSIRRHLHANPELSYQELELLAVHGVLLLLGYDHEEIEDEVEMFALQEKILGEWRALK